MNAARLNESKMFFGVLPRRVPNLGPRPSAMGVQAAAVVLFNE